MIEVFPLQWPVGHPRTPTAKRERALFHKWVESASASDPKRLVSHKAARTLYQGISSVRDELARFGATDIVISTNVPTRKDGLPFSGAREPDDPGVAVYFRLNDEARCLQCDGWDRVADNLHAIGQTIKAKRGEIRWKAGTSTQLWAGYRALPAMDAKSTWWAILGFIQPPNTLDIVWTKYETRILAAHPDRGGNANQAAEINAAMTEAERYYKEQST